MENLNVQRSDRDPGVSLRVLGLSARHVRRNIDLPIEWARSHGGVVLAFDRYSATNWHAHLVSTDGEVLLAFPFHDHADRILLGPERERFPIRAQEEVWEEQADGWWAWVKANGPYVYLAGCDGDDIPRIRRTRKLELRSPGFVAVDNVEFSWNRVPTIAYDQAWEDAVDTCRAGQPSPVGEWASESSDRVRLLA
jgi:hypothetical protein